MACFESLPIELLHLILSFLVQPEDDLDPLSGDQTTKAEDGHKKKLDDDEYEDDEYDGIETLCNVCLVSRQFRDVAQPLLFRELSDDSIGGNLALSIPFTKTIYQRPDLGKHVHQITILPFSIFPVGPNSLKAAESEFFKGIIKDLQLADEEETWISAMNNCDINIFIALLANKAPNLRGIHLPVPEFSIQPFIQLFHRNPEFLSNLESVWIESDDELSGFDIASYEKFLTLPKVKFSTFEFGDLFDASFPPTWLPGTLETEELAFHHCHIDAGALKKLMQACKKLKTFIYTNFSLYPKDRRRMRSGTAPEFNAKEAHEAALLHKDTLELFLLEYAMELPGVDDIEQLLPSRAKVGSFRDFSALEKIFIPHACLPPHPQFSSSLETLHITDCKSSIRELTQNIATDCKNGLYPKLTDVKVFAIDITQPIKLPGQHVPEGKTPEQCFLDLKEMFKGTDVNFRILPYALPEFKDYGSLDDDYDEEYGYDEDFGYDDDSSFEEDFITPFEELALGADPSMSSISPHFLMRQAMIDPELAQLYADADSDDDSWETEDSD
ncbi:hypothetical protein N7516_009889 [Penicillium verrucosum]|uniref:uncharacterized protein n=1 Tax=Penicillium verrucosum TaxID=60171 RepID=UPI0025452ABB|nr:uncharacterized protein N7516_009889 [Penicillium verrucosum]KAJ5922186.1 hypothetical protein N7516_009889 [Penicillium verrucosum]